MKKQALVLALAFAAVALPSAGHAEDVPAQEAPARKKIIKVKLSEEVTVIIDCNKLTADNKITFDYLKQFDTHSHAAAWTVPPERQRDPVILRVTLLHILNDQSLWTVEKFNKVLDACDVEAGSRKIVPEKAFPATQPTTQPATQPS